MPTPVLRLELRSFETDSGAYVSTRHWERLDTKTDAMTYKDKERKVKDGKPGLKGCWYVEVRLLHGMKLEAH